MIKVFTLCALLLAGPALAQDPRDSRVPQTSTPAPENARFVILSSPDMSARAYRLDRLNGQIHELITEQGVPVWLPTEIESAPTPEWNTPRFQLVTNGWQAGEIYLFDTLIGRTWVATRVRTWRSGHQNFFKTVWKPVRVEGEGGS